MCLYVLYLCRGLLFCLLKGQVIFEQHVSGTCWLSNVQWPDEACLGGFGTFLGNLSGQLHLNSDCLASQYHTRVTLVCLHSVWFLPPCYSARLCLVRFLSQKIRGNKMPSLHVMITDVQQTSRFVSLIQRRSHDPLICLWRHGWSKENRRLLRGGNFTLWRLPWKLEEARTTPWETIWLVGFQVHVLIRL